MSPTPDSPIICRTTAWYVRRMGLMFLMLSAFAGWFFKDYKFGYPRKVEMYETYKRLTAQPDGQQQWEKLSAEKQWDKVPDELTRDKIGEQRNFAIGLGGGALAVLITFLVNRGKQLTANADTFTTPGGTTVPFASVFRIDKTKWKHKGLASVFYHDAAGAEKKAVIDDLKYGGADQVLDRLMSRFAGEVIDLDESPPAPTDAGTSNPTEIA